MDDILQHDLQLNQMAPQMQKQVRDTWEELSRIDQKSKGVFGEQQRMQMEQQYMAAMQEGSLRMRMFGIKQTTFGKLDWVSADFMHSYYTERREAQQIHQVEESGKKKKSQQEEDAYARKGKTMVTKMKTSAGATGGRIWEAYQAKKQQNAVDAGEPLGTEFIEQTSDQTLNADQQTEAIANLMLKRDALAERVKAPVPKIPSEQAEHVYNQRLLEKINDAVQTWLRVGGVNEQGKRVSGRDKTSAARHLPLAIENYEFYVKNREYEIGSIVMQYMEKHEQYQETYKEIRDRDIGSTKSLTGLDQPIANIYKDDILNLKEMIAVGGEQYEKNKKLIQKVYEEYIQHSIAFAKRNLKVTAMKTLLNNGGDWEAFHYVSEWWDKSDFESRQHELVMDAAMAYVKYLLKGKQPDPTLAVYIEQHWHADTLNGQLDASAKDLYADQQGYADRIHERIREVQANEQLSERTKDRIVFQLENALHNPQNMQSEQLLKYSPLELTLSDFVKEKCQVTENDPDGGGYRDVARVLMPVDATELAVDEEQVKKIKAGLYRFATGKYLGDQKDEAGNVIEGKRDRMPCSAEERMSELPLIVEQLSQAKQDMEAYVNNHAEEFQQQSLQRVFQGIDVINGAHAKAQSMRDQCSRLVSSDLFFSLDQDLQSQITGIWDFASGLTDFIRDRSSLLHDVNEFASMRELLSDSSAEQTMRKLSATLNAYVQQSHSMHQNELGRRNAF